MAAVQEIGLKTAVEDDVELGEFVIAEYITFLLAVDTYIRYVEETTGEQDPVDDVIRKAERLLRIAESEAERMTAFLLEHLSTQNLRQMAIRAFQYRVIQVAGIGNRALKIRTILRNPTTMRKIFETNRAMRLVREAVASSMLDDADAALDKFAVIPLKNVRFKAWIKLAAQTAGSGEVPRSPVEEVVDIGAPVGPSLLKAQIDAVTATGAEAVQVAAQVQKQRLEQVKSDATEAAKENLKARGESDTPPKKSEVLGTVAAAVEEALSNPTRPQNVPEPLRQLDDEQRAASLTDGRVLVAAGAGAGKSTTLVARVNYLVRERRVDPSRILATSFNKKAAGELRDKIGRSVGGDALQQMSVGTMHSLFRRFIGEYGTSREKIAMGVAKEANGFVSTGSAVARTVQRIWAECFNTDEFPVPKLSSVMRYKSQWAGNNVTPAQARGLAKGSEEILAAQWYEMYEGLKGAIPGWKPQCRNSEGKAYESFMARKRPNGIRLGDFDDMLGIFHDILKREPGVRKAIQEVYDHILVDECLHESTEVVTPEGCKSLKDLQPGDLVLSFENGQPAFKRVLDKKLSSQSEGITVVTSGGRELSMTVNHRVYASVFTKDMIPEGCSALYLMHRADKGFRIGVSKNPFTREGSCSPRVFAERADALWILEVGEDAEILFKEQQLSLRYGVPTYVFEGTVRGCDQERIDRIFEEFGINGRRLLDQYGLDYSYPHWANTTYTGGSTPRRTLMLHAHRPQGSKVSCSWTVGEELEPQYTCSTSKENRALSRTLSTYTELRKWAVKLANQKGLRLQEVLTVEDQRYLLLTGGALKVGMELLSWIDGVPPNKDSILRSSEWRERIAASATTHGFTLPTKGCVSASLYESLREADLKQVGRTSLPDLNPARYRPEKIVEIRETQGVFYDISVEDSANFFANGLLSHNCQDLNSVQHGIIEMMSEHVTDGSDGKSLWMVGDDRQSIYGFRGARPDLFIDLNEKPGWVTRTIRTNYRCQPEIVEAANRLIAHNDKQLPMAAVPSPAKAKGVASIVVDNPEDDAVAALEIVEEIKSTLDSGETVSDHAVLCRTNKEIHAYETACIIRGVPYARKGASSFLGSPETKTFLSYVQLVTGTDFTKMQKSLEEVVNRPNRFFVAPEKAAEAVQTSLDAYARYNGLDLKSVNPIQALEDNRFVETLVAKLVGVRGGFKFDKGIEKVRELASELVRMQASASDEKYTTKDLFDDILGLKGIVGSVDPRTGRAVYVEQSFRESLRVDLRDAVSEDDETGDDEDEEDDETKGLGNIAFLYKLAETDPTDASDLENPPGAPLGFKAKIERYAAKTRELRVDIDKWDREQATLPPEQRKPPPAVYLGTVHSVKGAQWKTCFVQMPKGKFPFEPRVKPGQIPDPEELEAQMESERRLAYVALTRAAKNLTIVCPKVVGGKAAGVSPFVDEAQLTTGQNVPKAATTGETGAPSDTTQKTAWAEDF